MSDYHELAKLDLTGQAELVHKKELEPIELVDAAIQRIEALNPRLNAVVTKMFDYARKTAKSKLPAGPFTGAPYLLKDMIASFKGVPLSFGSKALKYYIPDHDTEIVRRLKHSGLIILGKTNVPEFGILPTTESELFGPCRNPWDTNCITGGSSGGSAAAVAARLVPAAHASDGGGSIRGPASCCGVFGFKPTRARNPLGPFLGDILNGFVAEHAITRTVRDSAALLDTTSGPETGDPYWAPPMNRSFLKEVGANPGKLKIAFSTRALDDTVIHKDCAEAVKDAADLCSHLGHDVEEASPRLEMEPLKQAFTFLWISGVGANIKAIGVGKDKVESLSWALYEMAKNYNAMDYIFAIQTLQRISRQIARFFQKYDIWITPVLAKPPVPIGYFTSEGDDPLKRLKLAWDYNPFAYLFNITGQPAMSVPLFWNDQRLPVGTNFAGRFGDEATLFRLAAQLEEERNWSDKKPSF